MKSTPRFGFIADFSTPLAWAETPAAYWHELLDLIVEVEELGYDTIWTAEHHFTDDGFATSPLLMLARISAVTERLALGTYVLLMPLHHPLRVAEDAAAVDLLSGGRLELGLGIGFRQEELDGFGVCRADRPSLLEESIEILRDAWRGEAFSHHGRHFSINSLTVTPTPLQPGGPRLWLGARAVAPALRAGRLGASLHLMGGNSIRRAYESELLAVGHSLDQSRVSIYKPVFVAGDPELAAATHRPEFDYFARRHAGWVGANSDQAFDMQIQQRWGNSVGGPLHGMAYLHGTPKSCLQQLRELYERKPFDDLIAPLNPPYDLAATRQSIRLFAREVVAPFKESLNISV